MSKNNLLEELASCWRGDWSEFDGRTLQAQIGEWIELADTPKDFSHFRRSNAMCLSGGGHWAEYCEDYACPKKHSTLPSGESEEGK